MTPDYEALYKAARKYIDKCPCDPDINRDQLAAWNSLINLEESMGIKK
jgi:hypothetical protein